MSSSTQDAVRAVRAAMQKIDSDVAKMQRERGRLEQALVVLVPEKRAPVADRNIAGPKAIEKVEGVLLKRGSAYQVEITEATGLNSGTVTHALRALAGEGKIVATENVRNRSREFKYVGGGRKPAKQRVKTTRPKAVA